MKNENRDDANEKENLSGIFGIALNMENSDAISNNSDPMRIFNINEACRYLDVSRSFIYKLIGAKAIPHAKICKRIFFVKKDLYEWIRRNSIEAVGSVEGAILGGEK